MDLRIVGSVALGILAVVTFVLSGKQSVRSTHQNQIGMWAISAAALIGAITLAVTTVGEKGVDPTNTPSNPSNGQPLPAQEPGTQLIDTTSDKELATVGTGTSPTCPDATADHLSTCVVPIGTLIIRRDDPSEGYIFCIEGGDVQINVHAVTVDVANRTQSPQSEAYWLARPDTMCRAKP